MSVTVKAHESIAWPTGNLWSQVTAIRKVSRNAYDILYFIRRPRLFNPLPFPKLSEPSP